MHFKPFFDIVDKHLLLHCIGYCKIPYFDYFARYEVSYRRLVYRDKRFISHLTESLTPFENELQTCCYVVSFAAIGRTLIPRYFRSIFEGGVHDMYLLLRHSKESFHNTSITLDCDQAAMVTRHGKPMFTKVSN